MKRKVYLTSLILLFICALLTTATFAAKKTPSDLISLEI
jgi:hypothetical protein